MLAADALSAARLAAAPWFAVALIDGGWTAPALFAFAAASDFADGRLARRAGRATARGALLDTAADVAFVLGAATQGARLGLVPWLAPAAIGLSVAAYAAASWRASVNAVAPRLARSRLGHAGGVVNYVLAGVLAGAQALPGPFWGWPLAAASFATVAANLAAVGARLLAGTALRAGR